MSAKTFVATGTVTLKRDGEPEQTLNGARREVTVTEGGKVIIENLDTGYVTVLGANDKAIFR